jgi:hypothetical protein
MPVTSYLIVALLPAPECLGSVISVIPSSEVIYDESTTKEQAIVRTKAALLTLHSVWKDAEWKELNDCLKIDGKFKVDSIPDV